MQNKKRFFYLLAILLSMGCFLFVIWLSIPVLPNPNLYHSSQIQDIDKTNRIELKLSNGDHLKTINAPEKVDVILEHFHTNYVEGWQYEHFTVKSPLDGRIVVLFFNKDQVVNMLRIGKKANEPYLVYPLGRTGRFLTDGEFKELIKLLEIDENLASH